MSSRASSVASRGSDIGATEATSGASAVDEHPGEPRRIAAGRAFAGLAGALVLVLVIAAGRGAVAISPGEILAAIGERLGFAVELAPRKAAIFWQIRLPRVVLAALVGAALASSGAGLQGIVRNALADPTLIGISGGAALGAVAWLVVGVHVAALAPHGLWLMPLAAFAGALTCTAVALAIARVDGRTSAATLLLGGVGLAALSGAGYGVLLYLADDAALRSITFWTLGSLGGATWPVVLAVLPPIALAVLGLPRLASDLDRLALGELEARHIGVDVQRLIRRVALLASLAVGAAVAMCGVIGFVGLVVPYLVRGVLGPGHRILLPASALGGAVLLVLADLLARTIVAPAELPVGVVTALVGAPVLLLLVRRGREVLP